MNIQRWIARREGSWKQLDSLLSRVEKRGLRSLQAKEIQKLASLYRSVSADLARARTNRVGEVTVRDLQMLTGRAYAQVYQGSRRQEWEAVRRFVLWGFPAVVQRSAGAIALATGLFAIAGLVSWWLSWKDPAFLEMVVPPDLLHSVRDEGKLWMGSIVGTEPFASSTIMINNIRVSFAALMGGMTAGLYTAFIMLVNGVMIGTIGTLVAQGNLSFPFWAFVFPHGALELPAIFLAGGAGFLLARGILFPGKYRRGDALKFYGQEAAQLMFGIVPLLVIAGTIEGFFSPNPAVPDFIKYIVGTGLFIALVSYLGRKPKSDRPAQ